jgi:HSP20 family protein
MATRDRRDLQQEMQRRPTGSPARTQGDPYSQTAGFWLDPFTQFRRLSEQMDRWFDTVSRTPGRVPGVEEGWNRSMSDTWAPELETFLRDDQFVVRMDLPGLDKEDVTVEVTDDSIVVHGERQQTHEEERDGYYRSERSYGRFHREVPLPDGAQPDSAKANYRDGVLEVSVTAPPRQQNRPRRIEIGAGATGDRREERQKAPTDERMIAVAHDTGRHDEPGD